MVMRLSLLTLLLHKILQIHNEILLVSRHQHLLLNLLNLVTLYSTGLMHVNLEVMASLHVLQEAVIDDSQLLGVKVEDVFFEGVLNGLPDPEIGFYLCNVWFEVCEHFDSFSWGKLSEL